MTTSDHNIKTTYNLISKADDITLRLIFVGIRSQQLKKVIKTAHHYLQNRSKLGESACFNCGNSVNAEDGEEICTECLMDNLGD